MNRVLTHGNLQKRTARKAILLVMTVLVPITGAAAEPLVPRPAVVKPAHTLVQTSMHYSDLIYVKFKDGLSVRLRDGRLTDFAAGTLAVLEQAADSLVDVRWQRLHGLPENTLDALRQTAQAKLGRAIADLNLEYQLFLPPGADASKTIDALNALEIIEMARPLARPIAAPTPPDFQPSQGYLNAPPGGIGTECIWTLPGGTGANSRVADLEYSWNLSHLDLSPTTMLGGPPVDPFNSDKPWHRRAWRSRFAQ